jgi:hypothetical protein
MSKMTDQICDRWFTLFCTLPFFSNAASMQ